MKTEKKYFSKTIKLLAIIFDILWVMISIFTALIIVVVKNLNITGIKFIYIIPLIIIFFLIARGINYVNKKLLRKQPDTEIKRYYLPHFEE